MPLVFVVDDDTDVLVSLRFLLETEGFSVRTFRSADSLLNAITMDGADCLVIDYRMPGMSGVDLAGLLRERDIDTPIILITGHPDTSIPAKSRRHPACAGQASMSRTPLQPYLGRDQQRFPGVRAIIPDLRDSTYGLALKASSEISGFTCSVY